MLDPDAEWITLNPEDLIWDNVIEGKIYTINKLSQYRGKTIEIDLEKLNNQKNGEINRVAKLKNVEFNQAKHFIGGGGVSGTIRASQECLHDNKIMEDISFEQDKTFFGTGG